MTKRTFKTVVLKRKIQKYEDAAVNLAFKSASDPETHDFIEKDYKQRKQELWDYILEFII